jgi:hypothetical protein
MKNFRYIALCAVVLLMTLGSSASSSSSAPRAQNQEIEECQQACEQQLLECFFTVQSHADGNRCLAAYRRCRAHCK